MTATKVRRQDFFELLKDLGYSKPEVWSEAKQLDYLKQLPEIMSEKDYAGNQDTSSSYTARTLNDIIEAWRDQSGIVLVDDEDEEDVPVRRLPKQEEEEVDLDEVATEEEESPKAKTNGHGEAPKKRGRPAKVPVAVEEEEVAPKKKAAKKGRPSDADKSNEPPVPHNGFTYTEVEKPQVKKVSLELAKKFRDMDAFPEDRKWDQKRADSHRERMRNGEFIGCEWATVEVEASGKEYRVNGKHSSTVAAELLENKDEEVNLNFMVVVRKYSVPTLRDAAAIYNAYDSKDAARTKNDNLRSYSLANANTKGLSTKTLSILTTGVCFAEREKTYKRISTQDQAGLLLKNPKFVRWYRDLFDEEALRKAEITPGEVKHLSRMSVVAAMYKTWVSDDEDDNQFWKGLRDDTDDPKDSPRRKLRNFLMTSKVPRASDREVYVKCLQAWNAWKNKEETVKLDFKKDMKTPVVKE